MVAGAKRHSSRNNNRRLRIGIVPPSRLIGMDSQAPPDRQRRARSLRVAGPDIGGQPRYLPPMVLRKPFHRLAVAEDLNHQRTRSRTSEHHYMLWIQMRQPQQPFLLVLLGRIPRPAIHAAHSLPASIFSKRRKNLGASPNVAATNVRTKSHATSAPTVRPPMHSTFM